MLPNLTFSSHLTHNNINSYIKFDSIEPVLVILQVSSSQDIDTNPFTQTVTNSIGATTLLTEPNITADTSTTLIKTTPTNSVLPQNSLLQPSYQR